MYVPVPTNATTVDPITGNVRPIPAGALAMFSSPADDEFVLGLVRQLDPSVIVDDAGPLGIYLPPVTYGSDGRRITRVQGTINGLSYVDTVGQLLQQRCFGSMYNEQRQPPYNKLFADQADFTGIGGSGQGQILELNWGHDPAAPPAPAAADAYQLSKIHTGTLLG